MDAFLPWETEARATIISRDNYLCNCSCILARNNSLHNFFVCNVFVDNATSRCQKCLFHRLQDVFRCDLYHKFWCLSLRKLNRGVSKPGGSHSFGKGSDCVADPFRTVPRSPRVKPPPPPRLGALKFLDISQRFAKGWFPNGGCSPVPKTGTRVHSHVPLHRKAGTRAHSPKPPFYETVLLFLMDLSSKGLSMVVSKRWFEFSGGAKFRYTLFTSI